MGRKLLELFLCVRAAHKPAPPTGADGRPLAECLNGSNAALPNGTASTSRSV
jgi:hypothetical protein